MNYENSRNHIVMDIACMDILCNRWRKRKGLIMCLYCHFYRAKIAKKDMAIWKVLKRIGTDYYTPIMRIKVDPQNPVLLSKREDMYSKHIAYRNFEVNGEGVHGFKEKWIAESYIECLKTRASGEYIAFPAIIPKGTPYWDNNEHKIASKKMIIKL